MALLYQCCLCGAMNHGVDSFPLEWEHEEDDELSVCGRCNEMYFDATDEELKELIAKAQAPDQEE